jgi:hypothetical protein
VGTAKDLSSATYLLDSVADIIPLIPSKSSSGSASSTLSSALPRVSIKSPMSAGHVSARQMSTYFKRSLSSSTTNSKEEEKTSTSTATSVVITPSSIPPVRAMRGIEDVWKLIPNQIDYARIVLGMSPLVIPGAYHAWAAGAYLFSHALDQVDGRYVTFLKLYSFVMHDSLYALWVIV